MSIHKDISDLIHENLDRILELRGERIAKEDGSYVTKGDLLCQDLIMGYFRGLPERFEIVSEEIDMAGFSYDEHKNYAVIDPIDGTENFTSGLKEWGISVAVYKQGKHYESMILLPELNIYISTGDPLPVYHSRIKGLSSSISKQLISSLKEDGEYRIMGCCVYNIYNVIVGSYEYFEHRGAQTWDMLAGLNLALEHGADVFVDGERYHGEFLFPGKKYPFKIQQKHVSRR